MGLCFLHCDTIQDFLKTWENKLAQARVANFQPWNRDNDNYSSTAYFEENNASSSYSQLQSQPAYSRPVITFFLTIF
jgi:hypothetical protein